MEYWHAELSPEEHVTLMTLCDQLFSWYMGCEHWDTYFCPERHGTYFGSFYMKDIPAMMATDPYSIDPNLTADYGNHLLNTLTVDQRADIEGIYDQQLEAMNNLVDARESISKKLRQLWYAEQFTAEPLTPAQIDAIEQEVLELSQWYGELDGEIVHLYAATFGAVFNDLTQEQEDLIRDYRESDAFLGLNLAFGDPCNSDPDGAYLYSGWLNEYPGLDSTDYLFE